MAATGLTVYFLEGVYSQVPETSPGMMLMVWYAVYGSNLSSTRFRLYLKGGQQGARRYPPCAAGASTNGDQPFPIDRELFFAKWSEAAWGGGGVAFLDPEQNTRSATLGRAYLLSFAQFLHIAREENGGHGVAIKEGDIAGDPVEIRARGWYRVLLPLGKLHQYPVVTLTGWPAELGERTKPSAAYKDTMRDGLKETYPGMTDADISKYLESHIN